MVWDVVKFYWQHSLDSLVSSPTEASGFDAANVLNRLDRDFWKSSANSTAHITFDAGSGQYLAADYFAFANHNLQDNGYISLLYSDTEPLSGHWTEVQSGGDARTEHGAVIIDDEMFVFGGNTGAIDQDLLKYNITSDEWTVIATSHPGASARQSFTMGVMSDNIFIHGGWTGIAQADLWKYGPGSNWWTLVETGPTRYAHASVVISSEMYIYGGNDGGALKMDTWKYNPGSNTWTEVLSGATARQYHRATAVGDKMYIFGGYIGANSLYMDMWEYDATADSWSEMTSGASIRTRHSMATINSEIFVFGGNYSAANSSLNDTWKYNPASDIWTEVQCGATTRYGHTAIVYNERMYIYGGLFGLTRQKDLWRYNPAFTPWDDFITISSPFLPTSSSPYVREFATGSHRLWALEVNSWSGASAPYIGHAYWGQKTELGYADPKTDPHAQEDNANVNESETGYLLGVHEKFVERQIDLKFSRDDGTIYDKLVEWWDNIGRLNFFMAWETSQHSNDVWIVRSNAKFDHRLTVGGMYRDNRVRLKGRKE